LKERDVPCKLWNYPGSGHSLAATEHCLDAYMNIALWMDEYLVGPYMPKKEEKVEKEIVVEQKEEEVEKIEASKEEKTESVEVQQ